MSFIDVQNEFMAHIRDPKKNTVSGIEDRRLKIYRDLFFNNIIGFLNTGFPVLASIYDEQEWLSLACRFFIEHDCRSPYFVDISKEFVEFLSNEVQEDEYAFPFIAELAHYEWMELTISVRKTAPIRYWQQGQSIEEFQFSPLAELVSYRWPVHQISKDYLPDEQNAEPFYFVIHRDSLHNVQFSQINQVTAWLITQLQKQPYTLKEMQQCMQLGLQHLEPEQVSSATEDIVVEMLNKEIFVLGSDISQ